MHGIVCGCLCISDCLLHKEYTTQINQTLPQEDHICDIRIVPVGWYDMEQQLPTYPSQ